MWNKIYNQHRRQESNIIIYNNSVIRRQKLLSTPRDRNLIRTVLIVFSNSPNRSGQQLRGIKVFRGNRLEISSLIGSDFPWESVIMDNPLRADANWTLIADLYLVMGYHVSIMLFDIEGMTDFWFDK